MTKTPTAHPLTFTLPLAFDREAVEALPELEDVAPSVTPGHLALSLTSGEDVDFPTGQPAVFVTAPDGLAVMLTSGPAYRLPPRFARLFAFAVQNPQHAHAVSRARAAHFALSRFLEDPTRPQTRATLEAVAAWAGEAARTWPGEDAPDGQQEDPPSYEAPDVRGL